MISKIVGNINRSLVKKGLWGSSAICFLEYPKCGATWISNVTAECLRLRKLQGARDLFLNKGVFQYHSVLTKEMRLKNRKIVVVVRDPRDVYVSYYNYDRYVLKNKSVMEVLKESEEGKKHKAYLTHRLNYFDTLPPFFSYIDFITSFKAYKDVIFVKYEDMHEEPLKIINQILEFYDKNVDDQTIEAALEKFEFEKITKRKAGQELKSSHKRKGIIGDYNNLFDKEDLETIEINDFEIFKKFGYKFDTIRE